MASLMTRIIAVSLLADASNIILLNIAKQNLAEIIKERLRQPRFSLPKPLPTDVRFLMALHPNVLRKRKRQPKKNIPRATRQRTIKEGTGEGNETREDSGNFESEDTGVS